MDKIKILCKDCGTTKSIKIEGKKNVDYGFIVIHKKNCPYIKKLLKNSVEAR